MQSRRDSERDAMTPRAAAWIVVGALGWASALMAIFWPGLCTNDGAHRLLVALSMNQPDKAPTGDVSSKVFEHVFPPMMSLVAAGVHGVTGSWGVLTLLHAWWFFASLGVLCVLALGRRRGVALWVVLSLLPCVWNHAVAILPDAAVSAGLMTAACCMLWGRGHVMLRVAVCCVGLVVACGYRYNTMTALAGVSLCLLVVAQREQWRAVAGFATAIVLAVVVATGLPRLIAYRPSDVVSPMLAWEHVGALKLAGRDDVVERHSLDDIAGAGATRAAMAKHSWEAFSSVVFGSGAPLPAPALRDVAVGERVRQAWWKMVRDEPVLYAKAKLRIWWTMLGATHQRDFAVIGSTPPAWVREYGVDVEAPASRREMRARVNDAGAVFTFATLAGCAPYTWLVVSVTACAIAWLRRRSSAIDGHARLDLLRGVLLLVTGWAYYAAFLVYAGSYEWRYFMPAFVLIVAGVAMMTHASLRRSFAVAP